MRVQVCVMKVEVLVRRAEVDRKLEIAAAVLEGASCWEVANQLEVE